MKTISTEKAKNAFKGDLSLNLTGQLLPYSNRKIIAEKDVLSAIMDYLARCSRVAWAKRITTGRFKVSDRAGTRWMQAGFVGCSDILGQLTDGRLLAVEVKFQSTPDLINRENLKWAYAIASQISFNPLPI